MSPIQSPISGQSLDYDPSTLAIPSARRADPHTLAMASRYRPDGQPDLDRLFDVVVGQESGGRAGARGKAGEVGLAQIKPSTAAQYGIGPEALAHPEVQKLVFKQYMGDLLRKYKGDLPKALAAYNAGPGNVDRGNIPESTRGYVSKALANYGGGGFPTHPDESTLEIPSVYRPGGRAGDFAGGFPSHPDESTLEIPSVYRPGGRPGMPQGAFAQNMLFTPQDTGQQRAAAPPPPPPGPGPGPVASGGGQNMVFPPQQMAQRPSPGPALAAAALPTRAPVLPSISAGAPPASLQGILATQGPESKYGPLGMLPPEAGPEVGPIAQRKLEGAVLGTVGGEGELPEIPGLSRAARDMVRRAHAFGVSPEDIAPLAQRVRQGTLTERGLSIMLKQLRAQLPEAAKAASAVRGAAENLPRDLLAQISRAVREGKITLQQAKRMLKAAGVGGAAVGVFLGAGGGGDEGTAQAGEKPRSALDQFQQLPQFQKKSSADRKRILDDFKKKSPEVQQQIIQRLTKPPAQPWYPAWASMKQGLFEPNAAYVKMTQPWADLYANVAEGVRELPGRLPRAVWEDIKIKPLRDLYYGRNDLPKPLTSPPGPWEKWAGRTYGPGENVLQGAANIYYELGGIVEKLYEQGGETAVPLALRWMVPFVKTRAGRILTPSIAFGLLNKALGGSGTTGAAFGAGTSLVGEFLNGIWRSVAGRLGKAGQEEKVGKEVVEQLGKVLPGIDDATEQDLVRLGTKGEIVDKVRQTTQVVRDRAYQEAAKAGRKFLTPVIDKGKVVDWEMRPLRETEQAMDQLGRYTFSPKDAAQKVSWIADQNLKALQRTRDGVVAGLNGIDPSQVLGDAWSRQRGQNAVAKMAARMFSVQNGVIDLTTGRVSQPNLLTYILKNEGDIKRSFSAIGVPGQEGFDALYDAASRHGWKGVMDELGERARMGFRVPHGPHLSLGRAGHIAGQTPIWMYPPRSHFALGAQPGIGWFGEQAAQ